MKTILAIVIALLPVLTGCTNDHTVGPGPVQSPNASTSVEATPIESTPTDSGYFDHVITTVCEPGKVEGVYDWTDSTKIKATVKNILNDSQSADYALNYEVLDSTGSQVALIMVNATALNGPIGYGDTVIVTDHFGTSTGELPADNRYTCKLANVKRIPVT